MRLAIVALCVLAASAAPARAQVSDELFQEALWCGIALELAADREQFAKGNMVFAVQAGISHYASVTILGMEERGLDRAGIETVVNGLRYKVSLEIDTKQHPYLEVPMIDHCAMVGMGVFLDAMLGDEENDPLRYHGADGPPDY